MHSKRRKVWNLEASALLRGILINLSLHVKDVLGVNLPQDPWLFYCVASIALLVCLYHQVILLQS